MRSETDAAYCTNPGCFIGERQAAEERARADQLMTENARLRGALVDLLTACEENTCGKTAETHCEWCAPGWAALR